MVVWRNSKHNFVHEGGGVQANVGQKLFNRNIVIVLSVGEPHQLNSVKPTEFSWYFLLIFWNDPLGLLGRSG